MHIHKCPYAWKGVSSRASLIILYPHILQDTKWPETRAILCTPAIRMKHTASQHNAVGVTVTCPFGSVTLIFSVPRTKNLSLRRQIFSVVALVYCVSVAQRCTFDGSVNFCPKLQLIRFMSRYDTLVLGRPRRSHNKSISSTRATRTCKHKETEKHVLSSHFIVLA